MIVIDGKGQPAEKIATFKLPRAQETGDTPSSECFAVEEACLFHRPAFCVPHLPAQRI